MNADGSNDIDLSNNSALDDSARWSPDGTKIVFRGGSTSQIFTVNPDGTGKFQVTAGSNTFSPGWSADGTRIVYSDNPSEIYIIDASGMNNVQLTTNASGDSNPKCR
jgi:Tol biopolymer transport system component